MEITKLIVGLIETLIWPMVIMTIVIIFYKQIKERLSNVTEIEEPGLKAKFKRDVEAIAEEVVDDRELRKEELIPKEIVEIEDTSLKNRTMLAFTAGRSRIQNLQYGIYYDPAKRNHNWPFKYIGLYSDKTVFAVGKLSKIVYCDYENGKLISTNGYDLNQLTQDEHNRIKLIIENTPYYELKEGHNKFFLVEDKFELTTYTKVTDYPIRQKKYFWLDEVKGFHEGMSAKQLAELLDKKEWE